MAQRPAHRPRSIRSSVWLPASLTVVLLAGGYVTADVVDLAPGPLTRSEPWPDAEPFPEPELPKAAPVPEIVIDEEAPIPSEVAVSALIEAFLDDDDAGPNPGVLVVDALTGTTLGEADSAVPMVAASTTKLATAVAAISAAGADYRLTTRVTHGALEEPEAVTIIGGGDLTLDAGMGNPEAVIGHGGVGDLAAQTAEALRAKGVTTVTDVVVDETLWEGPRMAPRWEQIDLDQGWIVPMAPLAINIARLEAGGARSQEPGLDVGKALRVAIEDHGISVTGEVRKGEAAPESEPIAEVFSAPLRQLAGYMLEHSDNVLAESVGRLAAIASGYPGSFDGATQAITKTLVDLGVDTDGLTLADASGLSSNNKITPRTLTDIVGVVSAGHPDLLDTIRGLPVAGVDGTLRHRMRQTAAAGMVAGKTGTLNKVATIAGQVHTRDGRILHVAVMTAEWESSLEGARAAIDRLLTGLAECGCS